MKRPDIETMNTLGKSLAATDGVRVSWGEAGILIGDMWHESVPLNSYLAQLCDSEQKPYLVPTPEERDVLVLALGRTMVQQEGLSRLEVVTDEMLLTSGVKRG